jgi:hypothetical protein
MKTILLAAGAAALVLSAGPTLAAAKHAATAAGPKQPIPYSQLSAYMKASPKQRMSKDWWSGQTSVAANAAPTAGADTSATASTPSPSLPGDTASAPTTAPSASPPAPSAAPSLPATPPVDNPPSTAVNPPATATPGAPPAATPPK